MNILLYKTTNANNDLNKTISNKVELVGALRDASSIIAPSILIQSNPIGYNYAYIPEFGRYYYIKNITAFRKGAYIVDLKCDVLMSFKEEILNMSGIVSRLTSGDEYANRDIKTKCLETHRKIVFENTPFTADGTYILVAQGGEETVTVSGGGGTGGGTGGTTDSGGTGGGTTDSGGTGGGTTDSGGSNEDGF